MNSQQVNTNATIHTKVQLGSDIRRFVLPSTNFEALDSMLRSLFDLPASTLKVCFMDEEEDWITIASDEELSYAVELSTSPLRLKITVEASSTSNVVESTSAVQEPSSEFGQWNRKQKRQGQGCQKGQGRECGRRGRGGPCGRGKGRGKFRNLTYEDRVNLKSERLTKRIQHLEALTQDDSISNDRSRVLLWRLQKLQEKLEQQQSISETETAPESTEPVCNRGRGCGRRGRGGRGSCCPQPTDNIAKSEFWLHKQNLIAARKSGDKEKVAEALIALKKAKQELKAQMSPEKAELLSSKKEALIQSRQALVQARKAGDKDQVQVCKQALQQAKIDFKQSKWEV